MSHVAPPADVARNRSASRFLLAGLAAIVPYLLLPSQPLVFDATLAVSENRGVQAGSLGAVLASDFFGDPAAASYSSLSYRPAVTLTYAAEVRVFGNAPWAFHLVDMLLHAAATIAVLLLLETLGIAGWPGIAAALLFAVHPLATEAVGSVVGRADVMASLGLLLALLLHLGAAGRRRPCASESGALACLAVALFSKEYAVGFPFLLVAADGIVRAGARGDRRNARWPWAFWGGAFLLLAAYVGVRWSVLGSVGETRGFSLVDNPLLGAPWWVRWSTASSILGLAAKLLFLPLGLSHHYAAGSLSLVSSLLDPRALLPAVALAAAVGAALLGLRRRGWAAPPIALALFLFPLLPSLNILGITGVLFAERWMYLPLAGLAILAGWALDRIPERAPWPRVAAIASASVLVLLAVGTVVRARDWGSPESLARSALREYPRTAKVWQELGFHLERAGRHVEAADALRRSLDLEPADPRAWRSYATALEALGRHHEAAEAWRRLIALAPKDAAVLWVGLGESELAAGDLPKAVKALGRAHELAPSDPGIRARLAAALLRAGDAGGAVRAAISDPIDPAARLALAPLLREGLLRLARSSPRDAAADRDALALARRAAASGLLDGEGFFACGLVASRAGDIEQARVWFGQALSGDPEILRRRHETAVRLEGEKRYDEAAGLYREILDANPGQVATLFNLGRLLLLASRPGQAVPFLERGLAIQDDPRARAMLAEARRRAAGGS